jgi:hypothetical protein
VVSIISKVRDAFSACSFYALVMVALASMLVGACASQPEIAVGEKAPVFSLPSTQGTTVSLSDYVGEAPVLLFFHMAVG